jgi:hypothetical protein
MIRTDRMVSFAMALIATCVMSAAASAQSTPNSRTSNGSRFGGSFRGTPEPTLIAIAGAVGAGYLALRRRNAKKSPSDV